MGVREDVEKYLDEKAREAEAKAAADRIEREREIREQERKKQISHELAEKWAKRADERYENNKVPMVQKAINAAEKAANDIPKYLPEKNEPVRTRVPRSRIPRSMFTKRDVNVGMRTEIKPGVPFSKNNASFINMSPAFPKRAASFGNATPTFPAFSVKPTQKIGPVFPSSTPKKVSGISPSFGTFSVKPQKSVAPKFPRFGGNFETGTIKLDTSGLFGEKKDNPLKPGVGKRKSLF